ncbi:hypothetical protein QR680_006793 [Steinernema hermaphroditum]|uniref:Uncharacterized protein n=1 Tax=Steinernema hermaphroditum TaxID=289476 RepID=A0AA39LXZ0_9BILA|nr:hypothetical protein QR680_006793 [Steinernema hermaphroditum]
MKRRRVIPSTNCRIVDILFQHAEQKWTYIHKKTKSEQEHQAKLRILKDTIGRCPDLLVVPAEHNASFRNDDYILELNCRNVRTRKRDWSYWNNFWLILEVVHLFPGIEDYIRGRIHEDVPRAFYDIKNGPTEDGATISRKIDQLGFQRNYHYQQVRYASEHRDIRRISESLSSQVDKWTIACGNGGNDKRHTKRSRYTVPGGAALTVRTPCLYVYRQVPDR